MKLKIDLNCDLGEGFDTDALLMPYITSANIACGYHAGNEDIIKRTVELCLKHKVAAGAHPSFKDRENFGRKEQHLSDAELYDLVSDQLSIFEKNAFELGCIMHHIKPHGALYNMAAKDKWLSRIIVKAIHDFDDNLLVYGLSGSYLISEAEEIGLKTVNEVFADRTYQPDGMLTPRNVEGALIEDEIKALQQVVQMINHKTVTTLNDTTIPLIADTVCLHGDGVHAVTFARTISQHLKDQHIEIKTI